jgi:hypothetical protein
VEQSGAVARSHGHRALALVAHGLRRLILRHGRTWAITRRSSLDADCGGYLERFNFHLQRLNSRRCIGALGTALEKCRPIRSTLAPK